MDEEYGDALGIKGFEQEKLAIDDSGVNETGDGDSKFLNVPSLLDDGGGEVSGEGIAGLAELDL
jgi:hypothetical protein